MRNLLSSSVPYLHKYIHPLYIRAVFGLTSAMLDSFCVINISQQLMRHTLTMEAKSAPETFVTTYNDTWRCNPEDSLNSHMQNRYQHPSLISVSSKATCTACYITTSVSLHLWVIKRTYCWWMKDQIDVTCYFISLLMCSACFWH